MNTYEMEAMIFEEAKKSAVGTRYDWKDLLSFESLNDLERALKTRHRSKEQCKEAFQLYFEDLIITLEAEDAENL